MASDNGSNSAAGPENWKLSRNRPSNGDTNNDVPTLLGSSSIGLDEVISMHLIDCDQCRKAIASKPVALGQKSGHCDTYWQLQLMRAEHEGRVNNIVAYTEFGDEARKGGSLE